MSESKLSKEALDYHNFPVAGKIAVIPTKPCKTQHDLSLAYSPGVAVPCLKIQEDNENAYKYTSKGNLVAVLSNGTAVLGLGNIGAIAGKPVMEGKGILFKTFADIDVFDIEVNTKDSDELIKTCQLLEPTFGGINLEDIKAPECFYIEEELKKTMNIPVFHDDQHGTAIVAGAALLNGLSIVNKDIDKIKVVINGAGASGLAIAALFISLGVKKENLTVCDTKGIIYKGRTEGMNKYKENFAIDTDKRKLEEAVNGCDVLFGLSTKGAFTADMIKSMAKDPIIMAMANPDPEITPEEVKKIRSDAIMATGRSDYPNQVNNVLCFPFIFRGALDVRATAINEEMKKAAAYAIADLAKQYVPKSVCQAYGVERLEFGKDYIIPKPFDPRVYTKVSIAVAKAAMESGVATKNIEDFAEYKVSLEEKMYPTKYFCNTINKNIKNRKLKIGFTNGCNPTVMTAAYEFMNNNSGIPVLIGNKEKIIETAKYTSIDISNIEIIDTSADNNLNLDTNKNFAKNLFNTKKIDGLVVISNKDFNIVATQLLEDLNGNTDNNQLTTSLLLANKNKKIIISGTINGFEASNNNIDNYINNNISLSKSLNIKSKTSIISDSSKDIISKNNNVTLADSINDDSDIFIFSSNTTANATVSSLINYGGFNKATLITNGFNLPVQIASIDDDIDSIITVATYTSLIANN